PAAQNIRVTKPADLPARATHWSVYISELSNSDILRRSVTVDINTATTDISAEPASTSPTMPIRNDPVLPTKVLAVWKNRLGMRNICGYSQPETPTSFAGKVHSSTCVHCAISSRHISFPLERRGRTPFAELLMDWRSSPRRETFCFGREPEKRLISARISRD